MSLSSKLPTSTLARSLVTCRRETLVKKKVRRDLGNSGGTSHRFSDTKPRVADRVHERAHLHISPMMHVSLRRAAAPTRKNIRRAQAGFLTPAVWRMTCAVSPRETPQCKHIACDQIIPAQRKPRLNVVVRKSGVESSFLVSPLIRSSEKTESG